MQLAKNSLEKSDISLRFFRSEIMPDVSANFSYQSNGVGGVTLSPLTSLPIGGTIPDRTVVSRTGLGSVLGDVFSSTYPTWTFGVTVAYPLGASTRKRR